MSGRWLLVAALVGWAAPERVVPRAPAHLRREIACVDTVSRA